MKNVLVAYGFLLLGFVGQSIAAPPASLKGHTQRISHLELSADGNTAVSRAYGGEVRVWDLKAQKMRFLFKYDGWLRGIAVSPKGAHALLWGPRSLELVDLTTQKRSKLEIPIPSFLRSVCFAGPDTLAISTSRATALYSWKTKKTTHLPGAAYSAVAATQDGSRVFLGGKALHEIDGTTGKSVQSLAHPHRITMMALRSDGGRLATSAYDAEIRLFARDKQGKWKQEFQLFGQAGRIKKLAFLGPHQLLSLSDFLIVWDLTTRQPIWLQKAGWKLSAASAAASHLVYSQGKSLLLQAPPSSPKPVIPEAATSLYIPSRPTSMVWLPTQSVQAGFVQTKIRRLLVGDQKGVLHLIQFQEDDLKAATISEFGRYEGAIQALALDPSGEHLAIGYGRGEVAQRHLKRKTNRKLQGQFPKLQSLAYGMKGQLLLVATREGGLWLFNAKTGQYQREYSGHMHIESLKVVGKDGELLFVNEGYSSGWVIRSLKTGDVMGRILDSDISQSASISQSGRFALTGGAWGRIKLWDIQTSRSIRFRVGSRGGGAILDPHGRFLLFPQDDGNLRFLSLTKGSLLGNVRGTWSRPKTLKLSRDAKSLAGILQYRVLLFRVPTLKIPAPAPLVTPTFEKPWNTTPAHLMFRLPGKFKKIVPLSANQVLVSTERQGLTLLDLQGKIVRRYDNWSENAPFALSPKRKRVATTYKSSRQLGILDLTNGKLLHTIALPKGLTSVAWSPQGNTLVVGARRGQIFIYDTNTWKLRFTVKHGKDRYSGINDVAFHPEGTQFASTSDENTVYVWDIVTGKALWHATLPDDANGVAFHPNGEELAVMHEDGKVVFFRTTGAQSGEQAFGGFRLDGLSVAYRSDGRIAAVGFANGILGLIDRTNKRVWKLRVNWNHVTALAWLPSGDLLAAFGEFLYRIPPPKDLPSFQPPLQASLPFKQIFSGQSAHVAAFPKADRLVLFKNQKIHLFALGSGARLQTLSGAPNHVAGWYIDKQRTWLAAWNAHQQVVLWRLKDQKRFPFQAPAPVSSLRFVGVYLNIQHPQQRSTLFQLPSSTPTKP